MLAFIAFTLLGTWSLAVYCQNIPLLLVISYMNGALELLLMIFVVRKQRQVYFDLKKALFFHDLVNRSRLIKYFVLIDLWML